MATKDARAKTESNEVWALGLCADRNRLWWGEAPEEPCDFIKGIPHERRKMNEQGPKDAPSRDARHTNGSARLEA